MASLVLARAKVRCAASTYRFQRVTRSREPRETNAIVWRSGPKKDVSLSSLFFFSLQEDLNQCHISFVRRKPGSVGSLCDPKKKRKKEEDFTFSQRQLERSIFLVSLLSNPQTGLPGKRTHLYVKSRKSFRNVKLSHLTSCFKIETWSKKLAKPTMRVQLNAGRHVRVDRVGKSLAGTWESLSVVISLFPLWCVGQRRWR